MQQTQFIEHILASEPQVRYVAMLQGNQLFSKSRHGTEGASSSESDRYEEILVNPTVLKITAQRGSIDCGGMEFVLIRYGNFFQFVRPYKDGHISICINKDAPVFEIVDRIQGLLHQ